jgi:hypothetical protein
MGTVPLSNFWRLGMKMLVGLTACIALAAGWSDALARGAAGNKFEMGPKISGFGGMGPKFTPTSTFIIPTGTTSGPVTINNPTTPPTTAVINNGTVNGGTSPGITITGPTPTTVTNNGLITSDSKGITISGASSTVVNAGTISVQSTGTSSAHATGISQGN